MHAKQLKTSGISVIQHIFVLPAHTASFLDEARAEQQSGPIGARIHLLAWITSHLSAP